MTKFFGTDGVRGIANKELNCELAYKIGKAAGSILKKDREEASILVGKDTRVSGDMLESAVVAGLCSVGVNAICVGVVPTPAVAYLTRKYNAIGGVIISASHNPVEYNGIKLIDEKGHKLDQLLESEIEDKIENHRTIPTVTGIKIGKIEKKEKGIEDYIDYASNLEKMDFSGFRVALDCAEGAAFYSGPTSFKRLGAEVFVIHNHPDGTNINKNCGSTDLEELKKFTVENNCDIGIAFDGDADRCLAIDEKGNEVNGDFIMMILAKYLKGNNKLAKNTLISTVMSNMGLFISCEKENIDIKKTKVGDKYVLETMIKEGYNLGGEQSGHIILLDYNTTGDGLITSLFLTSVLKDTGKKLSELKGIMKELPQVLINVKVNNSEKNIYMENDKVKNKIEEVENKLDGKGRVLIRASGTEPLIRVMIEGENKEEITDMAKEIVDVIKANLK